MSGAMATAAVAAAETIPWLTGYTFEMLCVLLSYGADKIPDTWFEKVPGGYYGAKEKEKEKEKKSSRSKRGSKEYGRSDRRDDERRRSDRREDRNSQSDEENYRRRHSRRQGKYDDETNSYDDRYDDRRGGRDRAQSMGERRGDDREEYYSGRGGYAPAAVAGGATAGTAYADQGRPASSGPASGYIPYADIYQPQPQQPYNAGYQTGQSASAAPTGYSQQQYGQQDQQYEQRHGQYDERQRYAEDSRSRSRSSSRSQERRNRRRERSRSRQRSRTERGGAKPRAKSSMRDRFDTSDRGLQYGALGAVAGGLVGSEVGKGLWPAVAGAVLGGLGANAFERNEKQKSSRRNVVLVEDARDDRRSKRASRGYDGNASE